MAHASSLSLSILFAFGDFIVVDLQKLCNKMVIGFTLIACLNVFVTSGGNVM